MKEGREVGRRPRKRTERVLSLTSDSDEHFLAARALRPCLPCWPTDTDTSESASSFLSAAFYSNKEELSAKVERERERSRSPQLPSYRLERESTSAAAEGRSDSAAAASAAATALPRASAATAPDRSRSIFGGKGSGPMDRRRRRRKAAASVRRGRTEEERTGSWREEEVAPVSPVEMLFERHQQSERANERAELTD